MKRPALPQMARKPVNRRIDPDRATRGYRAGESIASLAKQEGVGYGAMYHFLHRIRPELKKVADYLPVRADLFAMLSLKAMNLQDKLIDYFSHDSVIDSLTPNERVNLIHAMNASSGIYYDKERLERGKTTANVGALVRFIGEAHATKFGRNPEIEAQDVVVSEPTESHNAPEVSEVIDKPHELAAVSDK